MMRRLRSFVFNDQPNIRTTVRSSRTLKPAIAACHDASPVSLRRDHHTAPRKTVESAFGVGFPATWAQPVSIANAGPTACYLPRHGTLTSRIKGRATPDASFHAQACVLLATMAHTVRVCRAPAFAVLAVTLAARGVHATPTPSATVSASPSASGTPYFCAASQCIGCSGAGAGCGPDTTCYTCDAGYVLQADFSAFPGLIIRGLPTRGRAL